MLLNGAWQVNGTNAANEPFRLTGTVPGCIHTDLQQAGLIGDMYYRDHAKQVQWIEDRDFTYSKTFTVAKVAPNAFLEFDGLDTYCAVLLNGIKVGEADNMFIPHAFAVDGVLKQGENTVQVCFRSPVREVADKPSLSGAFTTERLHTRRMQCTYSWDWVDRFVTMGIFRDVRLVFRASNEIDHVYVYTKDINPYSAQIKVEVNVRDLVPEVDDVQMTIKDPSGKTVFTKKRTILRETVEEYIDLRAPQLWYPNGYGAQPLYTLTIKTPTAQKTVTFGIRKLTILQLEDEDGSAEQQRCRAMQQLDYIKKIDFNESTACFIVLVNDIKIMCKGANWVPCEPFPSAETPEKIERLVRLGANAGVNMLRVWGGGIFEQEAFYNACDRYGVLVTQDFLMACGTYPEEEAWFIAALQKETKAAALRLRNHACLAWWSGDNENAVYGDENRTDFPGYRAATYGIEPVLKQYDPQRYFLPSSPYGGKCYCSATRGTTHNTFFLGSIFAYMRESDFSDYRWFFSTFYSRFTAEQAVGGLPFVSSLKKFMSDEDIYGIDQSVSEFHTKNNPALGPYTLFRYFNMITEKIFGSYTDGADRVRKQQMVQCEWTRLTFEAHRRRKWFAAGLVYWMFNDCWPAANGWAYLDYYAQPKPAYYMFKRCAKAVIASLEEENGKLLVHVCNDALAPAAGNGKLYLYDFAANKNVWEQDFSFDVPVNTAEQALAVEYNTLTAQMNRNTVLLCDIACNLGEDRAMFIEKRFKDLDIHYGEARVLARDAQSITVTVDTFQPYVIIDEPNLVENCFALKKGEVKVIQIHS